MRRRGLTLDSGALIAYERGDQRLRALVRVAHAGERQLTVPTAVVAEVWRPRGSRWLSGLLAASNVEPLGEVLAQRAGELLGRTGTSNAIDAIVAASAAQRGDVIATSDPHDLQRLADELAGVRVWSL